MITFFIASAVGFFAYRLGKKKGEADMYRLCYDAEQSKREFFSDISRWQDRRRGIIPPPFLLHAPVPSDYSSS